MALKLYNTQTRQIEELVPLKDQEVRMYTCGPTVYHFVHIGNFRTFMFQDILRRYLLYKGFRLTHVMNITDVDDKIIINARKRNQTIADYTKEFEEAFLEDMKSLRIQQPEIMPKATEHIQEMLDLVSTLQQKGLTYQSDGSTYFRIDGFSDYGKLSHLDSSATVQSGRVDDDEYTKENPRDFVLWKAKREGEEWWSSPFGEGRPGWHLECSAMSMKYLGSSFDIHCGGVDLVFPHHENEIAQSEGATGRPFVKYWVHAAHLIVEGQKMSKSLGNFFTLRDLLAKGCRPRSLRYLLASVHYRKQLNFTFDGLEQSEASIRRVNDFIVRLREIPDEIAANPALEQRVALARSQFEQAMDDDLNTSAALASIFELVRDVNIQIEEGSLGGENRDQVLEFLRGVNSVFDVFDVEEQQLDDDEIRQLIEERIQARRDRNFQRADEIRQMLMEKNILLEDTREGTRWKRRN
ncbi:MAG: cysteine--tRNA ligase [Acidobacteriota bacterium]|nr:MAG: cysteine--tRNA ligase [Acidobacteriota bacterium]